MTNSNLIELINNQELNLYIKKVIEFSFEANKYFNDLQPWALKKTDPDRMAAILYTAVEQIKNINILLNPIMPSSTTRIFNILKILDTRNFLYILLIL